MQTPFHLDNAKRTILHLPKPFYQICAIPRHQYPIITNLTTFITDFGTCSGITTHDHGMLYIASFCLDAATGCLLIVAWFRINQPFFFLFFLFFPFSFFFIISVYILTCDVSTQRLMLTT